VSTYHSGDCREAQAIAERFERLALRTGDPALAPVVIGSSGTACTMQVSRAKLSTPSNVCSMLMPLLHIKRHTIWSRYDLRFSGRRRWRVSSGCAVFVDQGIHLAQASLKGAQAVDHKPTLCWFFTMEPTPSHF